MTTPTSASKTRTAAISIFLSALLFGALETAAQAQSATTTLGTRSSLSAPNPPVTSNANAVWTAYSRAADYPRIKRLPLQFITLTTGANAGEKLGVLVSVPADASGNPIAGKFPAILTQTAYRIDLSQAMSPLFPASNTLVIGGTDTFLIERGYVTVAVDVLGSGVSDGEEHLLDDAEQLAYGDTVSWITQQAWSNGSIGVAGTSYLGISALLTAERQQPAVKAAFVEVPMGDAWRDVIGTGGLLNGLFVATWLPLTQGLSVENQHAIAAYPQYAAQISAATQQHIDAINDFFIPLMNNALAGLPGYGSDDGDFWSQRSPLELASTITVPTFIIGGDHDIFQRGEPLLYEQLKRNVTTKLAILKGDHVHIVAEGLSGGVKQDTGGQPPASPGLLLQWFDQYLKGMETGAASLPTVTQHVIGLGENGKQAYASTTDWPHPLAVPQRLYLHGDRSLSAQTPLGSEGTRTVAEPSAPSEEISTTADGTVLAMNSTQVDGSKCSISYAQWTLGLALPRPCDNSDAKVERIQQALDYETPALSQNLYINGPIEADIWVSSTVTDAALSVRLDDVDASGGITPITNGLLSASDRAVDTSRSRYIDGIMIQPWHPFTVAAALPVVPNQPMLLPVEIFPTAALVRAGHRLRVSISASNQAQGIWSLPEQALVIGGISTIYTDSQHPSSIVLPEVPASALGEAD